MEGTLSCIPRSLDDNTPASAHRLSEVAIVAGLAQAAVPANPNVP